jgi:hypothetical protein
MSLNELIERCRREGKTIVFKNYRDVALKVEVK